MRENIICGSCELIRYNALTLLTLEYYEKQFLINLLLNFPYYKCCMVVATDLIIKCLVYSKKDRNFFLFLQTNVLTNIGVLYREQFQKET